MIGLNALNGLASMKAWKMAKLPPADFRAYKAGTKSLTVEQAAELASSMGYLLTFIPLAELARIEDAAMTLHIAALETPSTPACVHRWLEAQLAAADADADADADA